MNYNDIIRKYKLTPRGERGAPNYIDIPRNFLNLDENGCHEFNEVYDFLLDSGLDKIIRTQSGGISKKSSCLSWDVQVKKNSVEITVASWSYPLRLIIRSQIETPEGDKVTGLKAFKEFRKRLKSNGVELFDFAIEDGKEVKETIEKVHIDLVDANEDKTYYGAFHIDINSAYMAGIAKAQPELAPTINQIYEERKDPKKKNINKGILNATQGFMQSEWCVNKGKKYCLSHLSKAGIAYCNREIERLTESLKKNGFTVLARNTDGLWVFGDGTKFEDANKGTGLGQWKLDHEKCKIRFKSAGSYEYEEDGEYYPVVRGYTKLDKLKPREDWKWGDIYPADDNIMKFYWQDGVGFVNNEGEKL